MFKPSEYAVGKLTRKTTFYKDVNNNGILDSEDKVEARFFNAASNPELLDEMSSQFRKTGSGITYVKNEYLIGTKRVPIAEYNAKLVVATAVDFLAVCVVLFIAWYVLFPKRTKE